MLFKIHLTILNFMLLIGTAVVSVHCSFSFNLTSHKKLTTFQTTPVVADLRNIMSAPNAESGGLRFKGRIGNIDGTEIDSRDVHVSTFVHESASLLRKLTDSCYRMLSIEPAFNIQTSNLTLILHPSTTALQASFG